MTKRTLLASFFVAAMLFASLPAFAFDGMLHDASSSQTLNHWGRGGGCDGGCGGHGGCNP